MPVETYYEVFNLKWEETEMISEDKSVLRWLYGFGLQVVKVEMNSGMD